MVLSSSSPDEDLWCPHKERGDTQTPEEGRGGLPCDQEGWHPQADKLRGWPEAPRSWREHGRPLPRRFQRPRAPRHLDSEIWPPNCWTMHFLVISAQPSAHCRCSPWGPTCRPSFLPPSSPPEVMKAGSQATRIPRSWARHSHTLGAGSRPRAAHSLRGPVQNQRAASLVQSVPFASSVCLYHSGVCWLFMSPSLGHRDACRVTTGLHRGRAPLRTRPGLRGGVEHRGGA